MKVSTKNTMTPVEAKTFLVKSLNNATRIEEAVHNVTNCACKAYTDIFTFARWKAQGMKVPKGAIRVAVLMPIKPSVDSIKGKSLDERPDFVKRTINVWCRCVVAPYVANPSEQSDAEWKASWTEGQREDLRIQVELQNR